MFLSCRGTCCCKLWYRSEKEIQGKNKIQEAKEENNNDKRRR